MLKPTNNYALVYLTIAGLTVPIIGPAAALNKSEASVPKIQQDVTEELEPQAVQLLKAMDSYMQTLKSFSLNVNSSLDVVLDSGQKLQFDLNSQILVHRPNNIYATRHGATLDQEFFYDGTHLTIYDKIAKVYATVDAPATIDATLNFAREQLKLMAPAADFLYNSPYTILSAEMNSGFYVGPALIDGVRCQHLAFHGDDLDWQIWIEDSSTPVPHKYLITSTDVQSAPQYTAQLSDWNFNPQVQDASFNFLPPKDAEKTAIIPDMNEPVESIDSGVAK